MRDKKYDLFPIHCDFSALPSSSFFYGSTSLSVCVYVCFVCVCVCVCEYFCGYF